MEIEEIIKTNVGDISTLPTETKEKLVNYVKTVETEKETLTGQVTKLTSDVEFHVGEKKEIINQRDAKKEETRRLRETIDKAGGNTYVELYDTAQKKLEEQTKVIEDLKKDNELKVGQLDKIKEDSRNALLEALPKDSEVRKLAETFDFKTEAGLLQLKTTVELFKGGKFTPDDGRSGEFQIDPAKGWNDYTAKELDEIEKKNPSHWKKLKDNMFKK
jgi:hypothetical protein